MTSNPSRPSLQPLSTPKAGPTTSTTQASTLSAPSQTQPLPRPSSRARSRKAPSRGDQTDATNEKATIALIRRVLCPQANSYGAATPRPLHELLPPLTSSNEVDHQLYALIAIIIKEFVYSWYAKITPDHVFVDEVLQLVAHCTRALEERLRRIDIAELVLDDLPGLIEAHVTSYRIAKQQSDLVGSRSSLRDIYHALNPHPSLSPVSDPSDSQAAARQHENEMVYRQLLVQGTLAVLLPTEDLENICLRTLVGDILADLILGNEVSGRACQGWFVWETVTKVITLVKDRSMGEKNREDAEGVQKSRLERFGLLSTKEETDNGHSPTRNQSQASIWLWQILQCAYLVYVTFRFVVTGLFRVASTRPRTPSRGFLSSSMSSTPISHATETSSLPGSNVTKRPVLDYRLYGMLSQLLDVPKRMPWLGGTLALFQYLILAGPGRLGDTDGLLDRFLHETIRDYVLTSTLLPALLLAVRTALFPLNARPTPTANLNPSSTSVSHNAGRRIRTPVTVDSGTDTINASHVNSLPSSMPASVTAPPPELQQQGHSESEVTAIKRQCAASILSLVPRPVARMFFCISRDDVISVSALQQGQKQREKSPLSNKGVDQIQDSPSRQPSPLSTQDVDVEESLLLSAIETQILDLFSDEYCNRHLVYSIIETVLVKLLPELSERDVAELMEDRGVTPSIELK